jgi:hypothetical protein
MGNFPTISRNVITVRVFGVKIFEILWGGIPSDTLRYQQKEPIRAKSVSMIKGGVFPSASVGQECRPCWFRSRVAQPSTSKLQECHQEEIQARIHY